MERATFGQYLLAQFNGDAAAAHDYAQRRGRCFQRAGFHVKARQYRAAVRELMPAAIPQSNNETE